MRGGFANCIHALPYETRTMAHRSTLRTTALAGLGLLAACSNGGDSTNAAPRIGDVPQQQSPGAVSFSLDLGDYVTDREGATLTYSVTAGGGAFAGSTYTNTFDSMGGHTVEFTVTDGVKTSTGTFEVLVRSGDFAVVREDLNGLFLLDTGTNQSLRVAAAAAQPSLATGLADGRLLYQLAGAYPQLWLYDPVTRTQTRLAATSDQAVSYLAKTSDGRVVYSVGPSNDFVMSLYNPRTGLAREIGTSSVPNVLVTDTDLVFYEVAIDGQTDVYFYDPETDGTQAVGTDDRAEHLLTTLPGGVVLFSRIGAGGETHLMYFRREVGLVEVGADQTALATRDKSFLAAGSGNRIVFAAPTSGNGELFYWLPATGQTTPIATGSDAAFDALSSNGEVVFHEVVSGSEQDVYYYDIVNDVAGTVRDGSDVSAVLGVTTSLGTSWAIIRPSTDAANPVAISLAASPVTATWAAGGTSAAHVDVLADGDVVAARQDQTALGVFDASAGSWSTVVSGTGLAFAGPGLDANDFVFSRQVSGQTDLSMWDDSAVTSVVVGNAAGDEVFQARSLSDTILFTRVTAPNTNADLWAWDGTDATQVTGVDTAGLRHDHAVLGVYAGSR